MSRRCASANSARIPPSPWLSARMMTVTYLSVTEIARLQKMSDSTPSTAAVLKPPAASSDCSSAYKGLVPISPYTMPVAPTTAGRLKRRALFTLSTRSQLPLHGRRRAFRPQHAAATAREAAAAGEDLIDLRRIVGFALDLVVVSEFLARLDGSQRVDEHAPILDHGLAVRLTGVVDEARLVAVDAGVDDGA